MIAAAAQKASGAWYEVWLYKESSDVCGGWTDADDDDNKGQLMLLQQVK